MTSGSSFTVTNGSTVSWTAYVLVSPPPEVETLSFTVDYPHEEWTPVSLTNPLNVVQSIPTDWWYVGGLITVESSAIDSYGLWKLEFVAENHLRDLQLGPSDGALSSSATLDIGEELKVLTTSSWVTGAVTELELIDPTDSSWNTATNTTSGASSHLLWSFQYRKDITVQSSRVSGDLTNYPVFIDILDYDLYTDCRVDGADIIFVSGGNILSHEIERFDQDFDTILGRARLTAWVKTNLSASVDTVISMYYGNSLVDSVTDPEAVWTEDYLAVWHLNETVTDEATTGIHYDSTSGDYDGNQDGNDEVSALFSYGQQFDGTDDLINVTLDKGLDPTGDVTISGWFRLGSNFGSSSATSQVIMAKFSTPDDDMHIILVGTDYTRDPIAPGSLVFKVENNDDTKYIWTQTTSWVSGQWYNFVCTMDASNPSNNQIYIDGQPDMNVTTSGSAVYANLTYSGHWGIGGGETDGQMPWLGDMYGGYFDGNIDEVRISNVDRTNQLGWIPTAYSNQRFSSSFYTISSESERPSPDHTFKKVMDSSAAAGLWTARALYNDSGSSVNYRVGIYEREFTVRHSSSLTLDSPGDAIGDGVSTRVIGDGLFIAVNLTDGETPYGGVTGATITMNWTVSGAPTQLQLDDLGGGRYGKEVNTTDLSTATRWRINIQSSHPYYADSSTTLDLDLYHPTSLTYHSVSTTPVGFDFTATLVYTDIYTGSPITGATITLDDGSPVTVVWEGGGEYNISIPTGALSRGNHLYIFNASKPSDYVQMKSADIIFTLRSHYTAASVSGDFTVPWGEDTPLTIYFIDLDTGEQVLVSDVEDATFTSSEGIQIESLPWDYDVTLTTSTWNVGSYAVNLSITLASSDIYAPAQYTFNINIRSHYTSVSVTGILTSPYGNDTPLTVVLTDLDTGTLVDIADVSTFSFLSAYGVQPDSATSYDVLLDTDTWAVGTTSVTITVVMSGSDYAAPASYDFDVIIRSLTTYLHHEPTDLIFPSGDDFVIVLRVNVSESGNPNDGDPILGLAVGEFSVENATYPFPISIAPLGNGRYRLTIDGSHLTDDAYTIFVTVDPSSANYALDLLVISFSYRPARSYLSSPSYPQVTTPYATDVTISLNYTDVDRSLGIITATLTSAGISIYDITDLGNGIYEVTLDVSGFAKGNYEFNLTASEPQYESKTLTFTLTVRYAYTYAIPTVGALDIPVGNDPVFYVTFWDTDNDVTIDGATVDLLNWAHAPTVTYISGEQRYRIIFNTLDTDTLEQNRIVTFNFSKGANYQPSTFTISVTIRRHNTDFRLVSAVEPTSYNGIINISVYYGDIDNDGGIVPIGSISHTVENASGSVISSLVDDPQGNGYYIVQISASQFGLGLQTFNVTFSWSGTGDKYQTKWLSATVNIVGVDSKLTLMLASGPTPYSEDMDYIFFYSDLDGAGINNSTGDVHIYVSFQGVSVNPSDVNIAEIDQSGQPGNYSIGFNNTIFGKVDLFYMNVYINWTAGVAPYYTNRFDIISVRVLARDTLVSILPPTPTSHGENATFSFSYDDVTGGSNVPIENDVALSISLSLADYSLSYSGATKLFTVSFDTSQFGAPLGQKPFTLDVVWTGEPFYTNRTGQTITVTVIARLTVLDYQSPAPTPFMNNVTFLLNWTDVTTVPVTGITGATVTLYYGVTPIPGVHYTVTWIKDGEYSVEFNTTYYSSPGLYDLEARLTVPEFYISDTFATRSFNVRYRVTLLSSEPTNKQPYNSSLQFILNYQDLLTLGAIGNGSSLVTFELLNGSSWFYTITWNGAFQNYELTVETHNHPELVINMQYTFWLRMSYAEQSPFYGSDETYVTFELRERASSLDIEEPSDPTPYLDYAVFQVFYRDVDSSAGIVIVIGDFSLQKGVTPLVQGTDYLISNNGGGYYTISVNTTALDGLGITAVDVFATWTGGSPYHEDADVTISIRVTKRETNVEITVPPSITKFLDNVTFTFAYTDLLRGTAITSITASDIELWADGILLSDTDFMMSQIGGAFTVSVNSTVLSPNLVSSYNLTVRVDWNDAVPPYYFDDTTLMRITTTNRGILYAIDQVQEARLGKNITISFSLSDMDTGIPVTSAIIDFDGQTVSLTRNVDFWVVEGTGVDLGKYTIYVDTLALYDPGTYKFDLDISWNPSAQPYYANASTIVLTGVAQPFETRLDPVVDTVYKLWKVPAPITVEYYSFFYNNLTSGATLLNWTWPGIAQGSFVETGTPGRYGAVIDTSLDDVGTFVLTIVASKDRYEEAVTYVTIVVESLPSAMIGIDPSEVVFPLARGGALSITVYLNDSDNSMPIPEEYVIEVKAVLEGVFTYTLLYNGTPGYYSRIIPSGNETILDIGVYDVRLSAVLQNYQPAAHLFKIHLAQTDTDLWLAGETTEDMAIEYLEFVEFRVDLVLPDLSNESFYNANVTWHISELGADGDFTSFGNGTYSVVFDTTDIGFGIWPISFRARPWLNASEYAASANQIILNVKRIETTVEREDSDLKLTWGWAGYLRFNFTGITVDHILIPGAIGVYSVGTYYNGTASDLGNGTYLVYLDTQVLGTGTTITLNILFSKTNYQEGPSSVILSVVKVPTNLTLYIHDDYNDPDNLPQYRVPYGQLVNITLFYNDTDSSEGYIGGLENANLTLNLMYGPGLLATNFTIEELGGGYYSYLFDTMNPWIWSNLIVGEPGPQAIPYSMTFVLSLGNRSEAIRTIKITVVSLPTSFEVISSDTALEYGQIGRMVVSLINRWPGSQNGTLITGANFTVDDVSSVLELLELLDAYEDPTHPGYYIIEYRASSPFLSVDTGVSDLEVVLSLTNTQEQHIPLRVIVEPSEIAKIMNQAFTFGTPLLLIVVALLVAYVKVWSVPKRIRQINSQVKALRKGKIPKPVDDVKGRSELVVELFNDTFSGLAITRTSAQMPEESVMVDIPEMGELLIQLAILTNLDQVELDEFKADISKMKISEQAAFVKEVIHQEAIRAARREGIDVDEILKKVADQARRDLSDSVDEELIEEEVTPEPEILTKEEETPKVEAKPGKPIPADVRKEFEVSSDVEKLSTFELEDLRMNLVRKGIQAHEIETIMEQVRNLPRDLADELLKSFGVDEE
ncbi:MAG: LamG-like jellyroll fold domain-containing protein [Candidatus Thorarchaeota archaeon]